MATIAEFKKWLEQFPDDAEVRVAIQQEPKAYQSFGEVLFKEPELREGTMGDGWEFIDFTKNPYVKPGQWMFGKKVLNIGEYC